MYPADATHGPRLLVPGLLLTVLPALLAGPEGPLPRFEDSTERSGVRFRHACGGPEKDYIFEVNGSGAALFDFDGDGDLDLYLVNGSRLDVSPGGERPRDALWRNDGGWRFTDVTLAAGAGDEGWGCGAATADTDNDGDLDLYVTNWGPNTLYSNRGDGTFERASSGAEDPGMSTSASFGDFDEDGLVDLYVANYVELDPRTARRRGDPSCAYKGVPIFCGPGGLQAAHDSLYLNLGENRFRDASAAWGVRDVAPAYALGTLVLDVSSDGLPDVIVSNDTMPNYCFLNEGGRRFQEAGAYLGLAYNDHGVAQAGMGLASGDVRGTGRQAIFVTNFEDDTNTLYLPEPGGLFVEGTFPAGLGSPSYPCLGWGTLFLDAEGDGDLDLFVANGHVAPQADRMRASIGYRQLDHLFLNDGAGRFELCAADRCGPGLAVRKSSRGAACGDIDGDRDPDIVVTAMDDAPTLLENATSAGERRWLEVRLRGTRSNRAAIGARVVLAAGGRRQERVFQSGSSYASQCELAARFGLGGAARVDELRVEWPSGLSERFPPPEPGASVLLVEGEGDQGGSPNGDRGGSPRAAPAPRRKERGR